MAHADHLKLIKEAIEKKDVTIWNRWRRENPDVGPDLRGAELSGADLSGEYWLDVNPGVILTRLDLSGTNLSSANLISANLSNVDLIGTNLSSANLCRA